MEPLVSVVIPAYNAESLLEVAVDSLLGQPLQAQIIIVNDGSADNTSQLAHRYESEHENVLVIDVPNGGAGRARNLGIAAAAGDYIVFLDADDLILPNAFDEAFSRMLERGKEQGIDIFYTVKSKTDMDMSQPYEVTLPEQVDRIVHHIPLLEFWTCAYRRGFLQDNAIRFFEYQEQDVETAFRFRTFARTDAIEVREDVSFILQRNNLESNTHTWKLPVLYSVKGRIYAQLYAESGSLEKVKGDDLLFLRQVAFDMTESYIEEARKGGAPAQDEARHAFVLETLRIVAQGPQGWSKIGWKASRQGKKDLRRLEEAVGSLLRA